MKYRNVNFHKGKQSGFTLIELLMVVVILGILAYVSMSAFSGSPNAANATAIRSGATQIAKGVGYIHANIGNGIKAHSNPIANNGVNMLDVLIVGKTAVKTDYHARFDAISMRPLESEFRVIKRASGTTKGEYQLLSYPVTLDTDANCPTRKVCVVFDNVPDEVLEELLVRYGLDKTANAAELAKIDSKQSLPVGYVASTAYTGTNKVRFSLTP